MAMTEIPEMEAMYGDKPIQGFSIVSAPKLLSNHPCWSNRSFPKCLLIRNSHSTALGPYTRLKGAESECLQALCAVAIQEVVPCQHVFGHGGVHVHFL